MGVFNDHASFGESISSIPVDIGFFLFFIIFWSNMYFSNIINAIRTPFDNNFKERFSLLMSKNHL